MAVVDTLYKLCLRSTIQHNLLHHPHDIRNHIPNIIYEDLWDVQTMKNIEEIQRGLYSTVGYLELQYDEVDTLHVEYGNLWNIASTEMQRINSPHPYDSNPPNAPPMMFYRLYSKYMDYGNFLQLLDEWIDHKWELIEEFEEEKERLHDRYGDFDFNIKSFYIDEEDDANFERRLQTISRRIDENRVIVYLSEDEAEE